MVVVVVVWCYLFWVAVNRLKHAINYRSFVWFGRSFVVPMILWRSRWNRKLLANFGNSSTLFEILYVFETVCTAECVWVCLNVPSIYNIYLYAICGFYTSHQESTYQKEMRNKAIFERIKCISNQGRNCECPIRPIKFNRMTRVHV